MPEPVRHFLPHHEVRTIRDMGWPSRIENGELLKAAEAHGFDVLVTADQNIRYQQNWQGRKLALVVLGSNIWPVVRRHEVSIRQAVDSATPGGYVFIEMPLPPKPPRTGPPSS